MESPYADDLKPLSAAERRLLNHVQRWGSDGYPIRKIGRGWHWETFFGVPGAPTVFSTKRAAVAVFEGWIELAIERSKIPAEAHP